MNNMQQNGYSQRNEMNTFSEIGNQNNPNNFPQQPYNYNINMFNN